MPIWSKKKGPNEQALQNYMTSSQRRMELAARAIENAERALVTQPVNKQELTSGLELLGIYRKQQQAEIPPSLPGMEDHQRRYVAMLDIQYRKLADVISTGGENLQSIIAEEEALAHEAHTQQQGYQAARRAYGLPDDRGLGLSHRHLHPFLHPRQRSDSGGKEGGLTVRGVSV